MEDLDRRGGGAHFHLLLCELIGHAVPVVVELHVIVDVDAVGFPVAILVTCGGEGAQCRLVEGPAGGRGGVSRFWGRGVARHPTHAPTTPPAPPACSGGAWPAVPVLPPHRSARPSPRTSD